MASAVQSANSTSATRRGSIQCTPLRETPFGRATVGFGRERVSSLSVQLEQLRRIEAGADATGITQLALRVMVAHEQRTEAFAAAFGIGEPDDNKLLAIAALDLEPAAAPPRPVRLSPALRDDAFELVVACLCEKSRAVADLVVAVAQHPL